MMIRGYDKNGFERVFGVNDSHIRIESIVDSEDGIETVTLLLSEEVHDYLTARGLVLKNTEVIKNYKGW